MKIAFFLLYKKKKKTSEKLSVTFSWWLLRPRNETLQGKEIFALLAPWGKTNLRQWSTITRKPMVGRCLGMVKFWNLWRQDFDSVSPLGKTKAPAILPLVQELEMISLDPRNTAEKPDHGLLRHLMIWILGKGFYPLISHRILALCKVNQVRSTKNHTWPFLICHCGFISYLFSQDQHGDQLYYQRSINPEKHHWT